MKSLAALSLVLGFVIGSGLPSDPAPKPTAEDSWTLCSYFAGANRRRRICMKKPLAEAQKICDARVKKEGLEGTCDCTDDEDFINGRCG